MVVCFSSLLLSQSIYVYRGSLLSTLLWLCWLCWSDLKTLVLVSTQCSRDSLNIEIVPHSFLVAFGVYDYINCYISYHFVQKHFSIKLTELRVYKTFYLFHDFTVIWSLVCLLLLIPVATPSVASKIINKLGMVVRCLISPLQSIVLRFQRPVDESTL